MLGKACAGAIIRMSLAGLLLLPFLGCLVVALLPTTARTMLAVLPVRLPQSRQCGC